MNAVTFPGVNRTYAEDQPQYTPLPVMAFKNGQVISCWELSDEELAEVIKNKRVYLCQATFNTPLQPISLKTSLRDSIVLASTPIGVEKEQ